MSTTGDMQRTSLVRRSADAFAKQAWRTLPELAYIVSSFALAIGWFVVLVTLLSLGLGLSITLVGLPILAVTVRLWVAGADLERTKDAAVWADLLYLVLLFPLSLASFAGALIAIGLPLSAIAAPFSYLGGTHLTIGNVRVDATWKAALAPLVGLVLLPLGVALVHALALVHGLFVRELLGMRRSARLSLQVEELSRSRSEAVAAAVAERRRIERDLHDGGQQRLTALALDLGMARAKLDSDPETARLLVAEAHEEAKLALAELRNLARGIHPAILTDRGLDAALSALAARSPVPVEIDVVLPRRPTLAIESVAYFIALEALANVAKHARASTVAVRVRELEGQVVVEVEDDGRGGARIEPGGGLEGLATRIGTVDGTLTVTSPAGGPTTVRAVLPCGW
jgi:signal transduction histidine kinase